MDDSNSVDNLLKEKYTLSGYKSDYQRDRRNYMEHAQHYYKNEKDLPESARREHRRMLAEKLDDLTKQKRVLDYYNIKE